MLTSGTRRDIHGTVVEVSSDAGDAVALVERRLASFAVSRGPADLKIEILTAGGVQPEPAAGSRIVHEMRSGFVAYSDDLDELWVVFGRGASAHCVPRTASARIVVDRTAGDWEWVATRPLLTLCLLELLKRHGLYAIHAAGAAIDGNAVILAGASGCGKSTTALALLLDGWSLLGDDILFLQANEGRPRLLGFADEIDASPSTFAHFPSLGEPTAWPTLAGYSKHQLAPGAVRPGATTAAADPRLIVLPMVGGERHELQEVDEGLVLLELIPNVLLTQVALGQAQLDLLGKLVEGCRAYRLSLGPAVSELPALLCDALAAS